MPGRSAPLARWLPLNLVHGSMHGGWCWTEVAWLLRTAGHEVVAQTLTGLGERVHLARPDIDLDVHIADVVSVLVYEDLRDVVLVGHSSGALPAVGAADRGDHARRPAARAGGGFPWSPLPPSYSRRRSMSRRSSSATTG
jgi:pimeloyl-ACP methyl ester carboxylesterase